MNFVVIGLLLGNCAYSIACHSKKICAIALNLANQNGLGIIIGLERGYPWAISPNFGATKVTLTIEIFVSLSSDGLVLGCVGIQVTGHGKERLAKY